MSYFDLQVNGYAGIDFNGDSLTSEQARSACEALLEDGTTGILATVITDSMEAMKEKGEQIQVIDRAALLLDAIARYRKPVSLKILTAETGLHSSPAHRILGSLIHNGHVEKNR